MAQLLFLCHLQPSLAEAEGARDAAVKTLVVSLGRHGVHVAAAPAAVQEAIQVRGSAEPVESAE